MSTDRESQGVRGPSDDDPSATVNWDPYDVWLNRVKKPRDDQNATTIKAFRLDESQLTDTARLRILASSLPR